MPAAMILAVPVGRAVPAAAGLVVPVDTLLGVAIPGTVPTAGVPLVAGLLGTRDVQQRGSIRRPLDRYQEPTDDRPVRPGPPLPPVDGRCDLLGEGPVLRRGISLNGNVARRRSGYRRAVTRCSGYRCAVTRCSAAVLWPRAAGPRCIHACGELRLSNLRWSDRGQSNRRWSGRDGWRQGRGRDRQRRTGSLEPLVRHRPAARAEDDGHGRAAREQPRQRRRRPARPRAVPGAVRPDRAGPGPATADGRSSATMASPFHLSARRPSATLLSSDSHAG